MLSEADKLRVYAKQMEAREPLATKEHLLSVGHEEDLADQFFEDKKTKMVMKKTEATRATETSVWRTDGRTDGGARDEDNPSLCS